MKATSRNARLARKPRRFLSVIVVAMLAIVALYTTVLLRGSHSPVAETFEGLIDQQGNVLDGRTFNDRFKLVFFGFTQCSSICPATLAKVRFVLRDVEPGGVSFTPVFVSVDPEHDRPEVLKAYTQSIDPRIIGITGDIGRIDRLVQSYGALAARHPGAPGPFAVDHTARLYLVAPDNSLLASYEPEVGAPAIAADILRRIRS